MRVSHSLIPYSTGRMTGQHNGSFVSGGQHRANLTTLSKNTFPRERVYEGELIEKEAATDAGSRERINRLYTQQREKPGFTDENHPTSNLYAIESYLSHARITGPNLYGFSNILDIYV